MIMIIIVIIITITKVLKTYFISLGAFTNLKL